MKSTALIAIATLLVAVLVWIITQSFAGSPDELPAVTPGAGGDGGLVVSVPPPESGARVIAPPASDGTRVIARDSSSSRIPGASLHDLASGEIVSASASDAVLTVQAEGEFVVKAKGYLDRRLAAQHLESGEVTLQRLCTLVVRCADTTGKPLENVRIELGVGGLRPSGQSADETDNRSFGSLDVAHRWGVTDAAGVLRIERFVEGEAQITVELADFVVTKPSDLQVVQVSDGGVVNLRLSAVYVAVARVVGDKMLTYSYVPRSQQYGGLALAQLTRKFHLKWSGHVVAVRTDAAKAGVAAMNVSLVLERRGIVPAEVRFVPLEEFARPADLDVSHHPVVEGLAVGEITADDSLPANDLIASLYLAKIGPSDPGTHFQRSLAKAECIVPAKIGSPLALLPGRYIAGFADEALDARLGNRSLNVLPGQPWQYQVALKEKLRHVHIAVRPEIDGSDIEVAITMSPPATFKKKLNFSESDIDMWIPIGAGKLRIRAYGRAPATIDLSDHGSEPSTSLEISLEALGSDK